MPLRHRAACRLPSRSFAQRQIALFHQAWKYEGNEFPLENMRLPPGTIIEMGAYKGMKMPHILELWDKQLDRIVQKLHPLSHLDPSPCQAMGPQKSVTSYCPTHSHFYYHGIEMRPSNFRSLAASELKLKGLKLRGVGVESLHKPAASSRPAPPTRVCESKMSADIGDRLMSSMQASDVPNHATDNLRCTMMNVTTLDHFVTTHVRSPTKLRIPSRVRRLQRNMAQPLVTVLCMTQRSDLGKRELRHLLRACSSECRL